MTRLLSAAFLGAALLAGSHVPAQAIEWPVSLSDAKTVGESMSPEQVVRLAPNATSPGDSVAVSLTTPFSFAAFVYSVNHAKYQDLTPDGLAEITSNTTLRVHVTAFSDYIESNDDMAVVIKQGGKVVQAVSHDKPQKSAVTRHFSTTQDFKFAMASLDLSQPFTVVIANAAINGGTTTGETSWNIDPTTFK